MKKHKKTIFGFSLGILAMTVAASSLVYLTLNRPNQQLKTAQSLAKTERLDSTSPTIPTIDWSDKNPPLLDYPNDPYSVVEYNFYAIPGGYLNPIDLEKTILGDNLNKQISVETIVNNLGGKNHKRNLTPTEASRMISGIKFYERIGNSKKLTPKGNGAQVMAMYEHIAKNYFFNNIFVTISNYNTKTGWFKLDLGSNFSVWQYKRFSSYEVEWKPTQEFIYQTYWIRATEWDADGDGKFETKKTNTIIPKPEIKSSASAILPSKILEEMNASTNKNVVINKYIKFENEIKDLPKTARIDYILVPNDTNGTLKLTINIDQIYKNGEIVNNSDIYYEHDLSGFDKKEIVVKPNPTPQPESHKDTTWDVSAKVKKPNILASEIDKNNIAEYVSISVNETNEAEGGSTYSYEIIKSDNLAGKLLVNISASNYYKDNKIVSNKTVIKENYSITGFAKVSPFVLSDKVTNEETSSGTFHIYDLTSRDFLKAKDLRKYSFDNTSFNLKKSFVALIENIVSNKEGTIVLGHDFDSSSIKIEPSTVQTYSDKISFDIEIWNVFNKEGELVKKSNPITINNFILRGFTNIDASLNSSTNVVFRVSNPKYDSGFFRQEQNEEILKEEIRNNFWTIFANSTLALNRTDQTKIPDFDIQYGISSYPKPTNSKANNIEWSSVSIVFRNSKSGIKIFEPISDEHGIEKGWKLQDYSSNEHIILPLESYKYIPISGISSNGALNDESFAWNSSIVSISTILIIASAAVLFAAIFLTARKIRKNKNQQLAIAGGAETIDDAEAFDSDDSISYIDNQYDDECDDKFANDSYEEKEENS